MGALLLIGLVFILLGVAILIAGIVKAVQQSRQSAGWVKASGTVVGLVRRSFTAGSSGVYCPTVEFMTPAGQRVQFQSDFGTMPASHRVGQVVDVHYDPADANKAEVDSTTSRWFVPGCMGAMGILFFVLGLVLFVTGIVVLAGTSRS